LQQSLHSPEYTEAAIITFLVTASDLTLWSVGSACWGIIAGALTLMVTRKR